MKKYILPFLFVLFIAACGGDSSEGGNAPAPSKDYLSVPPSLELLADGQTTEITISANCRWTITKDGDWLTVNPMSGANNQSIIISATKNTTGDVRTAVLTVSGGSLVRTVTVTQAKANDTPEAPTLSVNTTTLNFETKGGKQSFVITSNTNWTISSPAWCSLSTTSGSGNATITVDASENTTTEQRTGQIVINGEGVDAASISVTQQAKVPSLSVNTTTLNFETKGGKQSFVITSNISWTISCPAWCSLSTTSGSGNATITVEASENTTTEQRTGQIVINGEGVDAASISVTQQPGESHEPGSDDNIPPS